MVAGCCAFRRVTDPAEAVKGEVMCDVNCEFEPHFFMYHAGMFEVPTVTLVFYGKITGEPKINEKYVSEYRWFDLKEAVKLKLGFDGKEILERFLKERRDKG